MRCCPQCGEYKPETEFSRKDRYCKTCCAEKARARYEEKRRLYPEEYERRLDLAKKYYQANREKYVHHFCCRSPERQSAKYAANYAQKKGRLKPPGACEDCGDALARLDKHHEDYSKPLAVVWLCRDCHSKRHRGPRVKAQSQPAVVGDRR